MTYGFGLNPRERQTRLLRGLANRCQAGLRLYQERIREQQLAEQSLQQEQQRETLHLRHTQQIDRHNRLLELDRKDEAASASYERGTLLAKRERAEVRSRLQKERKHLRKQFAAECQQQRAAAVEKYEKCKNDPEKYKNRQRQRIEQALRPILQLLTDGQQISVKRLGTPDVVIPPPEHSSLKTVEGGLPARGASEGEDITALLEEIEQCRQRAAHHLAAVKAAPGERWVESLGMLVVFITAALLWGGLVYLVKPEPFFPWMLGTIPAGGLMGMIVSMVLTPGIRRHTRLWLPRLAVECETAKQHGRQAFEVAKREAIEQAAALVQRREQEIKLAEDEKDRKTIEMDQRIDAELDSASAELNRRLGNVEAEFRGDIEALHQRTTETLNEWGQRVEWETKESKSQHHHQQCQQQVLHASQRDAIAERVRRGLQRGLQRVVDAERDFSQRFPPWETLITKEYQPTLPLGRLPVGWLRIQDYLRQSLQAEGIESATRLDVEKFLPKPLPSRLPVAMMVGREAGLLIECPAAQTEVARRLVQTILLRVLAAVPAGKVRLTLLDPLGRGQSFAPLMALADHDPELVGHRAWATVEHIEPRLKELTHHMEDILQSYLRDRFSTIDQYNALAGSMAEPYRIIAAMGLPNGLNTEAFQHLRALLDGGARCGISAIIVVDPNAPWPPELPRLPTERLLRLRIDEEGQCHHTEPLLAGLMLEVLPSPTNSLQADLVQQIGHAAAHQERVIVPFREITAGCDGKGVTDEGVTTPLGRQGVGRIIELELGEGVRQHVLIAGKTGSGKSSLLHTLITGACLRYTPDQLQLYLLDFKKGVEFKPYADLALPHARVIGIESEREFGKSVLERLDQELHRRGELFRAAGVQELGEYRRRTMQVLPRLMLVVDEFQELFVRDDKLAQDCTLLLDRLVRQGRSFGVHVILASQSLAGAYTLPRNTLGQMAVRIALQCSESDAGLILSDENTAARMLSRPGEAIYNDTSGLIEGNQPFQVAWVDHAVHTDLLRQLSQTYPNVQLETPSVVFEGNRPARWSAKAFHSALKETRAKCDSVGELCGVVGESVAIGPPVTVRLSRQAGRNVLIVAAEQELTRDVLGALLPSIVQDTKEKLKLIHFHGRPDNPHAPLVQSADYQLVNPRQSEPVIVALAEEVNRRLALGDDQPHPPQLLVIDPLERFRDLRHDEAAAYSFEANKAPGPGALATVLREGPTVGIHSIVCCAGAEGFTRWLSRASQHDLEIRILSRLSTSDSATLTDTADAASLGPAAMLMFDEAFATVNKVRVCNLPSMEELRTFESHFEKVL
jgi:S-DNA-T family DNA segregation ATPase FtsK/SpoIIIE